LALGRNLEAKLRLWDRICGRSRLALSLTAVVAAAALGLPAAASAAGAASTFTVTGFADGAGSCAPVDANGNSVCTTLRAAVHQANLQANSPTIRLGAGTYQLNLTSGGQLAMGAFTIQGTGPGGPAGTTIQQTDGQNRVIEVQAGPAKLAGVEITGGRFAPGWASGQTWIGGGILAEGPLVLQDALVTGNEVVAPGGPAAGDTGDNAEGGGVDFAVGAAAGSAIIDSTISGNSAVGGAGGVSGANGGSALGGGIAYEGNGALVVQASTMAGNAAIGGTGGGGVSAGGSGGSAEGGGIFASSNLTLSGSTVTGNMASGGSQGALASATKSGGFGEGGGIDEVEALAQIVNSTFFDNSAQGGAAAAGGTAGSGFYGGVNIQGSDAGAAIQSDTIVGNTASFVPDLDIFVGNPPNPYTFTIHDTIVGAGGCDLHTSTNPPTSESYNLDASTECGFTTANHDLIGVSPQLASALANNGGPTQTLAPATSSPVLGAGGQCLDPTSSSSNAPLAVDQRETPRPTPCDIGAFQSQPPVNTAPPSVSGQATAGQTLSCATGQWTGDGPLSFSYQWLRNGIAITGATSSAYVIATNDVGQSLACRVTATHYGSANATSGSVSVPAPVPVGTPPASPGTLQNPAVTLGKVTTSGRAVVARLGCRGVIGQVCNGSLRLTAIELLRGKRVVAVTASGKGRHRHTVVLAVRAYTVKAGRTVTIRLNAGRPSGQLLRRFGQVPVSLAVTQTTASRTRTAASRTLKLRPPPPKRHKRRG
jgi:hypothetical protein